MITLRPATIDDLSILQKWDTEPHVIDSDPNDDWYWEEELQRTPEWRKQFMAELNGRPIGFIQIIDPAKEESKYWGEIEQGYRAIDIWIGEKEDLGKGYGTIMMKQAIEYCFKDPLVKAILVDPITSNKDAIRFYERLGFKFVEERRMGEDDCCVYQLNKEEWGEPF